MIIFVEQGKNSWYAFMIFFFLRTCCGLRKCCFWCLCGLFENLVFCISSWMLITFYSDDVLFIFWMRIYQSCILWYNSDRFGLWNHVLFSRNACRQFVQLNQSDILFTFCFVSDISPVLVFFLFYVVRATMYTTHGS